ncbi:MAG: hypothetical protein ACRDE2_11765, partial [Chitinophagaceae bacterium]
MLLAALTGMLAIKNDLAKWMAKNKTVEDFDVNIFEKEIKRYIVLLSKGIETALISDKDHIIREAPFNSSFGLEFGDD